MGRAWAAVLAVAVLGMGAACGEDDTADRGTTAAPATADETAADAWPAAAAALRQLEAEVHDFRTTASGRCARMIGRDSDTAVLECDAQAYDGVEEAAAAAHAALQPLIGAGTACGRSSGYLAETIAEHLVPAMREGHGALRSMYGDRIREAAAAMDSVSLRYQRDREIFEGHCEPGDN